MRTYELTVIIKSGSVDDGKNIMRGIFSKCNATIKTEEDWGLKRLAYPIKELKDGFYWFLNIEAAPEAVKTINNQVLLNDVILRHMFVAVEAKKA